MTLARLQESIRDAAARTPTRDAIAVGPFTAFVDRERAEGGFSYAVPTSDAQPSADDVAALIDAFCSRGRTPRIEYLPGLAGAVEAAALAAGFTVELRGPIMTCTAHREAPPVAGLELRVLDARAADADIRALDGLQARAFGDGIPEVDVDAWRARRTGTTILALLDGEPAGGGQVLGASSECAEVVGIATAQEFRGRGIAAAVTAELVRHTFADGTELAFLTPGGAEAQRIYERAGFEGVGEFLHLSAHCAAPTR